MKKIDKKKVILIIIVLGLGLLSLRAYMANQTYYTSEDIIGANYVIPSGNSESEFGLLLPVIEKTAIYDFKQVNYQFDNSDNLTAYNTFMIEGLKPLTEYTVNVSFNSTVDNEHVDSFNVGVVNYPPESTYSTDTQSYITNITTNIYDEYKFVDVQAIDGFNKYQVELKFKTNEYGQGWLVIGAESNGTTPLEYNIGQIKITTTESKDANTVTTE
jgi:hypothetical protein